MFDERRVLAALAVLLLAYAMVGLLAFAARGRPPKTMLRRLWRRLLARDGDPHK
jgi:hypothetical protein